MPVPPIGWKRFPPFLHGATFAQWLANVSGETIVGGPADEPPEFVAAPDDQGQL